jgi:lipopolysaccharide transport system ATP-binding protein
MSSYAVLVESLGKQYQIGQYQGRYKSLRESLTRTALTPIRAIQNIRRTNNPKESVIWALKNVSFEIAAGEVVGIIGRNGAGKSTLLKILSRITEPTEGVVRIKGRVGSLLEVGTGFHPELTGRENIFLNGAILGMSRREIGQKFDEIVDFAEIEKFIDTPAKHYSSGMYMRLAFAVAAHLEPEVLLVDEVLAVGDAQFQKKCLGKMGEVADSGRTVLFVSHNMDAVRRLCKTSLCLAKGTLIDAGPTQAVIQNYLKMTDRSETNVTAFSTTEATGRKLFFKKVELIPDYDPTRREILCQIEYQVNQDSLGCVIGLRLESFSGVPIMTLTDNDTNPERFTKNCGVYRANVAIPAYLLAPGVYQLTLSAADMIGTRYDFHEGAISFSVGQSEAIKTTFSREGSLLPPIDWQTEQIDDLIQ